MIDHIQVQLLLRKQLGTVPGLPNAPLIAWENMDFVPPDPVEGAQWISEVYYPTSERLAATDTLFCVALYKITVFVPKSAPLSAAGDLVKAIGDTFRPGTPLYAAAQDGKQVQISLVRAERGQGSVNPAYPAWRMIPVQVTLHTWQLNS